ncbi:MULTISPECIES: hypothetical protein [Bacillaceae]|uniref:hypothetical protein n=1 Tax=Bacillaceae TaxID=186817 RepID=UPI001E2CCD55|nr:MULTISPECIES: hypothetical protein [Bacillaceae]MCE4047035.1 hypothetical protein [Bacillus sp. Au-Bac7]MCM3030139.1 hypothetical protein [Niallia sp. MER 6]MDL0436588.1 hypothetical protein [Niallia sp. SS-2023]UPO86582.1 hypothetical protein L8T27_013395 [Niallia sp. Man26]
MKKLFITFICLLTIYVIYFDLNHGTLNVDKEPAIEVQASSGSDSPGYFEHEVKAGETVLSIIENETSVALPVSIDTLIADFKKWNDGVSPEDIQVGKVYTFPHYINGQ